MNRKMGDRIVIGAMAAASVGAALVALAPQAMAQRAAPKAAAAPATFRDCPTCPEMVRIPAGSFMMGSPPTEASRNADEGPQHSVSIRPFAAGKFEISFDEWDACVADGGCAAPPGGAAAPAAPAAGRGGATAADSAQALLASIGIDQATLARLLQSSGGDAQQLSLMLAERGISRAQFAQIQALLGPQAGGPAPAAAAAPQQGGRGGAQPAVTAPGGDGGFGRGRQPVINISWLDAQAYVAWLSKKTGKPYRLLTEAEWEYATRAGSQTVYFWGDTANHNYANISGVEGKDIWPTRPAPVGSLDPNPWGLHDTSGNVAEWVQDCYNRGYDGAPNDGSAWQAPGCVNRVLRGSSWTSPAELHRSANRDWVGETYKSSSTGFRVARAP